MNIKHIQLLKKCILSQNCPNLILYSDKNINKLNELLKLFNINNYDSQNNIEIKLNNNKILFDMSQLNNSNILQFFNNLINIIRSNNHYSNFSRIIIFNNYNLIKNTIQNKFRVILEKYRSTTLFILLTDKYNSIINPIRSRCLSIRFPSLTPYEKRNLIRQNKNDLSYENKSLLYDHIYKINNQNEIKLYSEYYEGFNYNYLNPYQLIINRLKILFNKKFNIQLLNELKDISYNLKKYNLYNFYNEFLEEFLIDPKYIFSQKVRLIYLFSESEYKYIQSYHSIIHIESFLFQFYFICQR